MIHDASSLFPSSPIIQRIDVAAGWAREKRLINLEKFNHRNTGLQGGSEWHVLMLNCTVWLLKKQHKCIFFLWILLLTTSPCQGGLTLSLFQGGTVTPGAPQNSSCPLSFQKHPYPQKWSKTINLTLCLDSFYTIGPKLLSETRCCAMLQIFFHCVCVFFNAWNVL